MDVLKIPFFMFRRYVAEMTVHAKKHDTYRQDVKETGGRYMYDQGVLDEIALHDKHLHALMMKNEEASKAVDDYLLARVNKEKM